MRLLQIFDPPEEFQWILTVAEIPINFDGKAGS
jgi:hypothetical protein